MLKNFACALVALFAPFVLQGSAHAGVINTVIVIAMENTNASSVYGNWTEAPYINGVLIPQATRSSNFVDTLPDYPSQPHYMIMEGGTHKYYDRTFTYSEDPSSSYSTGSYSHLIEQMRSKGKTWMSYQQSMNSTTGACPIKSSYPYTARHNPFVYFRSISGNPPSKTNSYCASHHRNFSQLSYDISKNALADYVFITPDNCNNMHDKCGTASRIRSGDNFLSKTMPSLISWANSHSAAIFVVWDEGNSSTYVPFLALGPGVKKNYSSSVKLTHQSLVKSIEQIFGLPMLSTVSTANTFSDLFKYGSFP